MPRNAPRKPAAKRAKSAKRTGGTSAKRSSSPPASTGEAAYDRIAAALEAIAGSLPGVQPGRGAGNPLGAAEAFVWHPAGRLIAVPHVSRVELSLLKGIDRMRDILT